MSRAKVQREILCVAGPNGTRAHALLIANERWLPIETIPYFHYYIEWMRHAELRVGMVCMLESNAGPGPLLRLFRKAWDRFEFYGLDYVFAALDPGNAHLYQRMQFEQVGRIQQWPWADSAEVRVLRLNVAEARATATGALRRRFLERGGDGDGT